MNRTITAMFDTRSAADAAADRLVQELSLDRAAVRVHGGNARQDQAVAADEGIGFWAALRDLFVPDEDRSTYAEGLRRGGFLVSAEIDDSRTEAAMDVLEAEGAVDLDSREAQWRESGWSGETMTTLPGTPEVGVAGTTREAVPARPCGAGGDFSNHPAPGSMSSTEGRMVGSGQMGTGEMGTGQMGTGQSSTPPVRPLQTATPPMGDTGDRMTGREEVIPVVEEQVRVGKREVERGRVRVRSYVVETPVREDVTLHAEHVRVERRDVDRAVAPGDEAFRERTIEAVEHGEEAVVSKETRITGEVVVTREGTEHTETVEERTRRTEVEIDDDTTRPKGTPRTPRTP